MREKEREPLIIICRDCNVEFVFTVGEQNFYEEKAFTPPKSCAKCRTRRKIKRDGDRK